MSEQTIYVPERNRSDTPQRLMNEVADEKIAAALARAEESLRTARLRLSQAGDEVAESAPDGGGVQATGTAAGSPGGHLDALTRPQNLLRSLETDRMTTM